MARVVILNGIGSAGKSSIARALQEAVRVPFLHVQMDAFLDMIRPSAFGQPDGLVFEAAEEGGHPVIHIRSGPLVAAAMRGFRASVAAMAAEGLDLIVDDVMFGADWSEYDRLLAGHQVTKIGVLCPLDVLESREAARGDRAIGLARGQWTRVHQGTAYDLTLDSAAATPAACAARIARHLGLETTP